MQPTELPPEAPKKTRQAKWRKLASVADVRLALASVIKKTYDGHMDPDYGRTCIVGLHRLGELLNKQATQGLLQEVSDEELSRELRRRLDTPRMGQEAHK